MPDPSGRLAKLVMESYHLLRSPVVQGTSVKVILGSTRRRLALVFVQAGKV
jgi:hypothetical protein